MMRNSAIIQLALLVFIVAPVDADDRDLLDAVRAEPNVLVVLDSGSSMARDAPSSTLVFPAGGDDDGRFSASMERVYPEEELRRSLGPDFREILRRGSKMHQAKRALGHLIDQAGGINLGFTFFDHPDVSIDRVDFIYRVEEGQPAMMDGSRPGDPLLLGLARRSESRSPFPRRYGENGDRVFVARSDPFRRNGGTEAEPREGDLRLVSFLVDGVGVRPRPWAEISEAERIRRHLFYFPSYDFDALPADGWIQAGLLGVRAWHDLAWDLGLDLTGEGWKDELRRRVVNEIESRPLGRRDLVVLERYEVWRRGRWIEARRADCSTCAGPRTTRIRYSQHTVGYGSPSSGGDLDQQCPGMVMARDGVSPIVGMAEPDPVSGETEDGRMAIRPFLEPESSPVFFFPTRPDGKVLPSQRQFFLPLSEAVPAIGNRPLAQTLREIQAYLRERVGRWDDPLAGCRETIVILITDGGESCEDSSAPCDVAAGFSEAPVYVIAYGGSDRASSLSLECVAAQTGGRLYTAANSEEIGGALKDIVGDIEQRSRSFASITLPPSDREGERPLVLGTFTPLRGRSMWRGRLEALPAGSLWGVGDGPLTSAPMLWEAGDILAARWDWGDVLTRNPFGSSIDPRAIYFGADMSGAAQRRDFAYPGDETGAFERRRELGVPIFGEWPAAPGDESEDDRLDLRHTVDFIRGVAVDPGPEGRPVTLRDPDLYGWCREGHGSPGRSCNEGEHPLGLEKLGDIFHSKPEVMASPSCPACFWTDFHAYREYFALHRHRRSVVFVGADDGALHAFDAGLWSKETAERMEPRYDVGSGRELFAWVPRSVMGTFPALRQMPYHRWTVDGTPTVADVFIDPSPRGAPIADRREWRTILLWGQRRGGRSYVCLDVTQPDPIDENGEPRPAGDPLVSIPSPSILRDAGCRDPMGDRECSLPWPAFLWEFTDSSDEDGNGAPDLGLTWSRPVVAFVRILRGGLTEERMVTFFGGGFSDPSAGGRLSGVSGNFIYGLDVETGAIVFKARVDGMVPGDVQLLDVDSDGFVEALFFGTTAGKVYRVDLEAPGVLGGDNGRVESWRPRVVFAAGPHQPFFMRPTLVPAWVDPEGAVAIAVLIGSGNRDDLLEKNEEPHRFYAFVPLRGGSLGEDDLVALTPGSAEMGVPLLGQGGAAGWYLELDSPGSGGQWEKVVTPALAFEGTIVFSTFSLAGGGDTDCGSGGEAKIYRCRLLNGDPLPGEERFEISSESTVFAGDPQLVTDGEGNIRVFQVSDDLKLKEPLSPSCLRVDLVDWREE